MPEDLKKKSLSSVKLLALPLGLTYVIKFIQTPILALFLSPADFGIWGLANVLIKAMESITEVGIQKLIIQRKHMEKSFIRSIWGIMIIRGIFITGVALAIVPFYASFVDTPDGKFIFTLAIIVPAIQSFTTPALYLAERDIEFKNIAFFDALGQILFFVFVVALVYIYQSVLAMVIALLIVEGIKVFMSYGFFGIPTRPGLPEWPHVKEIFYYGKHFFLIAVGSFVTIQLDDLTVGKLLGSDVLGFYMIGYTLINVAVTIIRKLFGRVLFPYYTKLVDGDDQAHDKINHLLEDQMLLLCVVFGLIFSLAPPLIHLLFDEKWIDAIPIIQILTFTGLLRGLGNLIVPLFLAEKKQNILAVARIIEVVLFVPLIYLFTTAFGAIGTAYSVWLIFFIALTYRVVMAYRLFSLEVFKSTPIGYIVSFCIMITLAFITLLNGETYFYIFEYTIAPLFLLAVGFYFYREEKNLSYFQEEYIQYG